MTIADTGAVRDEVVRRLTEADAAAGVTRSRPWSAQVHTIREAQPVGWGVKINLGGWGFIVVRGGRNARRITHLGDVIELGTFTGLGWRNRLPAVLADAALSVIGRYEF